MKFLFALALITMIIPFHSCSLRKGMSYNQREQGHYQLYSYPDFKPSSQDKRYKRLVITSINDLNGNIASSRKIFEDPIDKSTKVLEWGGASAIKSYVEILRKKYPGQTLLVDSGSFMNQDHFNKKSIFLYNFLGVDVANLGLNEFALNIEDNISYLRGLIKESNFPILASNLVDLKTNKIPNWENLHIGHLFTVNGVNVGVIGLFSPDLAMTINQKNLTSLYFQNLPKTIIQTSSQLRRAGAQVIITLLHSGVDCTTKLAQSLKLPKEKVNFEFHNSNVCNSKDNEVIKTLSQLPPQTIDAVVTANTNSKVANVINSIPVVQNFGQGQYLSWFELYYDTKLHRVAIEKTIIHQPIQLCHYFFEDTQDCYGMEKGHDFKLVRAKFLGEPVILNVIP